MKISSIQKKAFAVVAGAMVVVVLAYLAIFGRALRQPANHLGIALALPKVILCSEVARVDDETYLAKDRDSFLRMLELQGFIHIEQLGAGYFFQKDGDRYISVSKMYSSHFRLFSAPKKY